ncbi:unnamed protein product [Cylicocyclus nassatus]|uniref:Uncharacterized protein n=1 Tax=Cylicocyclus nassatus TaxID=53992 RepID=A0AA36GZC2_CYLNA|nr:unnamed protein product [Cylicocyclus nassatus]
MKDLASSILSAAKAGVLVVSAGEILMMIVKGLMKLYFPKSGEDTQVFCQNMRSLLLSIAGFIVLFFQHPALFNINAFACGVWLYLETTCYSLSIGLFTLESQNVHEVVYGDARKSHFWDKENKTPYVAPPVARNFVAMGLILGISMAMTTAEQMSKLVTNWSCMGHFSQQTLNVWLPVVIFNTCAALTATCFAYKSYFILTKIPQYRHKTNVYLDSKKLDVKPCIEKCYRNVAFVALGPWLLLLTWLTLALSFDWVTVGSINLIAMIVSFFYTACNFLQSAFTNPNLYSKYVRLAMKFCPKTIAPQIDPVTMWTRDEVLKNGDAKNFVPSSIKDRLRIQWMQTYAKTKIEENCSKSEALYSVYVNQMGKIANGASLEQAEQIRHLNQEWAARTHRKDPQPDPARRTKYEAELDRLTRKLCDAWNGTQALKKNSLRNANEHNEFLVALKNYLEVNDYDPFEYCPLTMVDGQGNMKAIKCLKKPAETIDPAVLDRIQCQLRAHIDDVHKRNKRDYNHQQFDPRWLLMSDQEKRLKRLQDCGNDVWNMAKQNHDYMSRVKAL